MPPSGGENIYDLSNVLSSGIKMKKLAAAILFAFMGSIATFAQSIESSSDQDNVLENITFSIDSISSFSEQLVSVKFDFTKKPSSFYYEVKANVKLITFGFPDTKSSLNIDTIKLPFPFHKATKIEHKMFDLNKFSKIQSHFNYNLVFNFKHVPIVTIVEDQNSIIMNYKWSTDPSKMRKYVVHDYRKLIIILISCFVTITGAFVIGLYADPMP
jgi:hypothetical protein